MPPRAGRRFARLGTAGRSPLEEHLATAVADDAENLAECLSAPHEPKQHHLLRISLGERGGLGCALFGPKDGDVLTALARADRALTGRAIERETHASHGGVQRAVDHLVAEGVIKRERAGRAYLYRLNREHLAAAWIQGLATLRLQLLDRLRGSITKWQIQPTASILFGSAARGEAGPSSDLDLLLVRPRGVDADDDGWREQVMTHEQAVTAWTGNDARVLEYGEEELGLDEPVLATAAAEGVELQGSLRRLLTRTSGSS